MTASTFTKVNSNRLFIVRDNWLGLVSYLYAVYIFPKVTTYISRGYHLYFPRSPPIFPEVTTYISRGHHLYFPRSPPIFPEVTTYIVIVRGFCSQLYSKPGWILVEVNIKHSVSLNNRQWIQNTHKSVKI